MKAPAPDARISRLVLQHDDGEELLVMDRIPNSLELLADGARIWSGSGIPPFADVGPSKACTLRLSVKQLTSDEMAALPEARS